MGWDLVSGNVEANVQPCAVKPKAGREACSWITSGKLKLYRSSCPGQKLCGSGDNSNSALTRA